MAKAMKCRLRKVSGVRSKSRANLQKRAILIYLDAIHIKLRQKGKIENTAVYTVLGVDLEGHRDVLGHWVGEGSESSNFLLVS